jgi:HEAT repeat protein
MTDAARRRAVALAGHTGDHEVARRGIDDADANVRATALAALHRLGELKDADVERALRDPDARVRRRAAELAAHHPHVDILDVLAHDLEPLVSEAAAFALGERDASAVEPRVIDALAHASTGHADALVREAAVAALGALGDPRGLPAILAATSDKPAIRRRAVLALAPFEGAEVDAALQRALTDRDWQVRQAAEDLTQP